MSDPPFTIIDLLDMLPIVELSPKQMNELYSCMAPENIRFSHVTEDGQVEISVRVPVRVWLKK